MDRRNTLHYHNNLPQGSLAIDIKERISDLANTIETRYGADDHVSRILDLLDDPNAYIRCDDMEQVKKKLGGDLLEELGAIQTFLRTEYVLEKALHQKKKDLALKMIENIPVISPRLVRVILTKIYDDEWEYDDMKVLYGKVEEYDRDEERNIMVFKAGYLSRRENFWVRGKEEKFTE